MKRRILRTSCLAATALVLAASGGAHGQDSARVGRSLAANCAACHGTNGKAQDAMPVLAGRPKEYLMEQMQAFKTGKRQATIMHQLAKGYSDEQIAQIADYFSKQK